METKIIIYTDKITGKYERFDRVTLTEKLTKEKIDSCMENWNNNAKNETKVQYLSDPVLIDFAEDVCSTRSFDSFITYLKDCMERLDDVASVIRMNCDELTDFLNENYPQKEEEYEL